MQKIAYIGVFRLPNKNAAALRALANAEILEKIGYEVLFFGISNKPFKTGDYEESDILKNNFKVYESGYPQSIKEWFKYEVSLRNLKEILNEINGLKAIICYNCPAVILFKLTSFAKKRNIKVISDSTEWFSFEGKSLFHSFIKCFDTIGRIKFVNKKVDGLIVTSSFLKHYYKKKEPISVIPTLIGGRKNNEDLLLNSNVNVFFQRDRKNLIYVGTPFRLGSKIKKRSRMKDRLDIAINLLLQAKKEGIKFKFHIIGISREEYLFSLPQELNILEELKDMVQFYGKMDNTIARNYIKQADFTILIRDDNKRSNAGFPTKIVESIECGTPVITTKTSDLPKYIIEEKNGFFIVYNKGKIDKEKFLRILRMPESEIRKMKDYCINDDTFLPSNWISEMKKLFE